MPRLGPGALCWGWEERWVCAPVVHYSNETFISRFIGCESAHVSPLAIGKCDTRLVERRATAVTSSSLLFNSERPLYRGNFSVLMSRRLAAETQEVLYSPPIVRRHNKTRAHEMRSEFLLHISMRNERSAISERTNTRALTLSGVFCEGSNGI